MKLQLSLKSQLITVLFVLIATTVLAQTGKISGSVSDQKTGEAIIGASVKIKGTNKGAATDVNGKYAIIDLSDGTYTLQVSYIGYTLKEIANVVVKGGDQVTSNLEILEDGTQTLDGVQIIAKANRESESALNLERRNSTLVLQKIGAQELSRKGLSNVSEGVTKIAGVSVVGNKNVFVRGLGDRYNNATLNGLPIPSTNPDLKLIPLDIFPTSVVKNIGVTKSYSPELYGDFSGGSIDIVTKDYPENAFFKVGISSGSNSMTTGRTFYTTDRTVSNFFGFDRVNRALPDQIASQRIYKSQNSSIQAPGFTTDWSPVAIPAPLSNGFSLSGGNLYDLGDDRKIGFLANLAYKNDYRYNEGVTGLFNAQEVPDYLYNTERFSFNTNTSGLFNLYYSAGSKSNYSITALYVNDSSNDIFDQAGFDGDLSGDIYARRNSYVQNSLLATQLAGNHQISERAKFKLALGYSNIVGSTPDRTQNSFIDNKNGTYSFLRQNISDNHRFFADLLEDDFSGSFSMDLSAWSVESSLKSIQLGLQGRYKTRAFKARQIELKIGLNPSLPLNGVEQFLSDRNLGSGEDGNTFRYDETYYAPNDYEADLTVGGTFMNFNFEWNKRLKLIAGLRVEYALQNTYFKEGGRSYDAPFEVKELKSFGLFPAVTVKYATSKRTNLLFAASKTISRPLFVESAPFRYNVGFGIAEGEGNVNLLNSSNYNADLKYEFYPSVSELMAISAFGKYIDKPIELTQVNSASPLFTYINTDRAILAGVELEYNRNIGAIVGSSARAVKNMSIGLNASYIYSRINISKETIATSATPIAPTHTDRPLFGASPYLLNFDYSYKHNWSKHSTTMFTVTYNVFGKRLFVAGSQQTGDIYEMPVKTLDFIVNTKLNQRIGLDFSIANILDPKVKFQQEFTDHNLTYSEFRKGVNMGLNLSYAF